MVRTLGDDSKSIPFITVFSVFNVENTTGLRDDYVHVEELTGEPTTIDDQNATKKSIAE